VIVDVNVTLSRWPFRRLAGDESADLVSSLRRHGVMQAWAGSYDGILHRDIAGVNARLAADCRTFGQDFLVPFGSINPRLPDWQEDLRRCHEDYKMPGIRLHPNYHGYDLRDPAFAELLKLAAAKAMVVQIALCMEDERTQHPLMRVPPVDVAPLADRLKAEPALRLVILNCYPQLALTELVRVAPAGQVCFDLAMVEGVGGVARLVQSLSIERVLFGSHSPLFYMDAAHLKMKESGLTDAQQNAIYSENALRLLNR